MYIAIEGGEGTGKSTLINQLKKELPEAVFVSEPFPEAPHTKQIREILESGETLDEIEEICLFAEARKFLNQEVLTPALDSGKTVISDRSIISSLVYQYIDKPTTRNQIVKLNAEVDPDFRMPDLVILLDGPISFTQGRLLSSGRKMDSNDSKPLRFHQEVREEFLNLSQTLPNSGEIKFVVVDITKDINIQELIEEMKMKMK